MAETDPTQMLITFEYNLLKSNLQEHCGIRDTPVTACYQTRLIYRLISRGLFSDMANAHVAFNAILGLGFDHPKTTIFRESNDLVSVLW